MSPELQNYYKAKQRRMAFYIVENEGVKKENPPEISAIIGLDKELEALYYADRRPPIEKNPVMHTGMKIRRNINSNKKEKDDKDKEKVPKQIVKKDRFHCPSLPTQWRSNLNIVIPKAEFGHFYAKRKVVK